MLEYRNPNTVAPPFSPYSQAVTAPSGLRWLYVSGQVGVDASGRLAQGIEGQTEQAFRNILLLLADAAMGPSDLVRLNGFITRPGDVATFRTVRGRLLGGARPAATLVVVAALAHPDWLVEIEAVAAAP